MIQDLSQCIESLARRCMLLEYISVWSKWIVSYDLCYGSNGTCNIQLITFITCERNQRLRRIAHRVNDRILKTLRNGYVSISNRLILYLFCTRPVHSRSMSTWSYIWWKPLPITMIDNGWGPLMGIGSDIIKQGKFHSSQSQTWVNRSINAVKTMTNIQYEYAKINGKYMKTRHVIYSHICAVKLNNGGYLIFPSVKLN